jgi:thioredoxin 1
LAEPAEPAELVDVTDRNFADEVLTPGTLALVDFWSDDCAPCHAISPILSNLASHYDGRVKFVKMNVYDNPATPAQYGVRAMPTVLAFSSGQVVGQITGARPRSVFDEMIQKLL